MLVRVSVGFTPLQLALGQPAAAPDTVEGAESVLGAVVNVTFPFLMDVLGTFVGTVDGPTLTLFCPGAMLPPAFWHWYTADPLTVVGMERSPPPRPDSVPVHCTVLLVAEPEMVHVGSPPFLKCGLAAGAAGAVTPTATRTVTAISVRRISPP